MEKQQHKPEKTQWKQLRIIVPAIAISEIIKFQQQLRDHQIEHQHDRRCRYYLDRHPQCHDKQPQHHHHNHHQQESLASAWYRRGPGEPDHGRIHEALT